MREPRRPDDLYEAQLVPREERTTEARPGTGPAERIAVGIRVPSAQTSDQYSCIGALLNREHIAAGDRSSVRESHVRSPRPPLAARHCVGCPTNQSHQLTQPL